MYRDATHSAKNAWLGGACDTGRKGDKAAVDNPKIHAYRWLHLAQLGADAGGSNCVVFDRMSASRKGIVFIVELPMGGKLSVEVKACPMYRECVCAGPPIIGTFLDDILDRILEHYSSFFFLKFKSGYQDGTCPLDPR